MASRYFRNTGNTSWNVTTNWSATDGGVSVGAIPTAADDVFLTALSGNLNMNAGGVCLTFNCTGYAGTMSGASGLTVSGNVTLSSAMTITYTGTMTINAVATLTSNGKVWGANLSLATGTFTTTFADPWDVGTFSAAGAGTRTINGSTLTVRGGLSLGSTTGGTTNIIMAGTGNFSGAGNLTSNLTINTAGTITLNNTGTIDKNFTYIAGTVNATGTATFSGGAQTIDCGLAPNNMSFNHVNIQYATSMTLLNDLMVGGNFTLSSVGAATKPVNGFNVRVKGNLTMASAISGTTKLIMEGLAGSNVTWSGNNLISTDFTTNSLGTVNVSGMVQFGAVGKTLKYQAGSVVTTGSELDFSTGTIDTNGIVWNIVTLFSGTGGAITTLASNLTCNTFQNTSAAHVLNGSNLYCTNLTPTTNLSGTTNIIMNGGGVGTNGTWAGTGIISNNINVNTAGSVALGTIGYSGGNLTYTAGTFTVTPGSTFTYTTGTLDAAWNAVVWDKLTFNAAAYTLTNNWTCTGTFTSGGGVTKTINGFTLYIGGDLTMTNAMQGTTEIILNGTGTQIWSGNAQSLNNNMTINSSGTISVPATVYFSTGKLKHISGAFVSTGALSIIGSATLDISGMPLNNFRNETPAGIITLLSPLIVNGTVSLSNAGTTTFAGTAGFTINTLQGSSTVNVLSLTPGNTYRITSALTGATSTNPATPRLITSTIPGTKVMLILNSGATCNIGYTSFQDIDASGGRQINSFNGAITNCNNVFGYIDPVQSIAKSFAA